MPARIYSLARELKIDSKELVELCAKAGIPGKSPLASLADDEVTRLKDYLGSRGRGSGSDGSAHRDGIFARRRQRRSEKQTSDPRTIHSSRGGIG